MKFIEEGHQYIDDNGKNYTSVTTVIHSLEKPKDWEAIAAKYAKKVGKTKAEIQTLWKEENLKSVVRGKDYHSLKQDLVNSAKSIERNGVTCSVKFHTSQGGELIQPDFKLENNTLYTEFLIWDEESGICGASDEVEVVNNAINVNDHKTNKKLDKEAYCHPVTGKERMLYPIAHVENCNWMHYCIQLSLYMYLLWKKNKHLKIGKLTINWVEFDKEGKVVRVTPMNVPYLRKEAKDIVEYWKSKN